VMGSKPKTKLGKGATLIAESARIAGDVRFSDQLYLNGHVEGDVRAEEGSASATVVISDIGSVKGEVDAPIVVVNGRVEGNVRAGTRVELAANARITGNVYYKLIEMQLGAMVEGQLVHVDDNASMANVHALHRGADGAHAQVSTH
jgi:cytoskeletal protein CcmA (bactofilin family)